MDQKLKLYEKKTYHKSVKNSNNSSAKTFSSFNLWAFDTMRSLFFLLNDISDFLIYSILNKIIFVNKLNKKRSVEHLLKKSIWVKLIIKRAQR